MKNPLLITDRLFCFLEEKWDSPGGQKILGSTLVFGFIFSIVVIDINSRSWLPDWLSILIPKNHLVAIEYAFLLLLIYEVINLILSLANSMSVSVGKQFEVLSLFLLRDIFKEFSHFDEPLRWEQIEPSILPILVSGVSALGIFVILIVYYKLQFHQPITKDNRNQNYFISAKKIISLVLLISFLYLISKNIIGFIHYGYSETTFEAFYTILIFTDVLIVLLSLRYSSSYHVAFRNSGFVVSTVIIRLSLIAPLMMGALLGIGAAIFALGVSYAYNLSRPVMGAKTRFGANCSESRS